MTITEKTTRPAPKIDTAALAAIVKRLEAGDVARDIDARVAVALAWDLPRPEDDRPWLKMPTRYDQCAAGTYWLVQRSGMSLRTAPEFTTSLDVVTALQERVLPEWWLSGLYLTIGGNMRCSLRSEDLGEFVSIAPTEPAARLAAVLKAVIARENGNA